MPMEAERIEVLKMIQSKQINAEDGARLLKALVGDRNAPAPRPTPLPTTQSTGAGRWFKVAIAEPGGEKVNLSLPLQTIPSILRFASRWVPEEHRDALQAASDAIGTGFRGDLVHVEQPNGERVRIWIE
ncbi:MAG TPA: hypothetical protein VKT80_04130 [Chloroflexota bacterium]|nr:hypothetical protein [Chloroflexota bacterium]